MLLTPQPASGKATSSVKRKPRRIAPTPAHPRSLLSPPPFVKERDDAVAMSAVLDIRINMCLRFAAGMGDGTLLRIADGLSIAPYGTRLIVVLARLPGLAALGQFLVAKIDLQRALLGVEADDIAILDQPDRPADRRFRPDMADAEAA